MTMKEEGRRKKEEGRPRRDRAFRRLIAYQKATALSSAVFSAVNARPLPPWLVSQVMRAAMSVYSNIAEGYTRGTLKDYIHFLDMARASLAELESHLDFMVDNGLLNEEPYARLCQMTDDVGNILVALMRSLQLKLKKGEWNRLAEPKTAYEAGSREQSAVADAALLDDEALLPSSSFLSPSGRDAGG